MHNVYLIGDCHALRIYEHHDLKNPNINFKVWGKGGANIYHFDAFTLKNGKVLSDGFETNDPKNWDKVKLSFNNIINDGKSLILPWFGYIDVKTLLPKYNDSDEIAKRYVENLKKNFGNSKIRIIEPHPQFFETIIIESENLPVYDYESRLAQNNKLCEALRKYSLEYGFGPTITQEQIYQATELERFTFKQALGKNTDGLRYKYTMRIYNLFLSEIYKTLGI